MLTKVPGIGGDQRIQEAEDIKSKAFDFNPDDYASEDVQRQLMSVLMQQSHFTKKRFLEPP